MVAVRMAREGLHHGQTVHTKGRQGAGVLRAPHLCSVQHGALRAAFVGAVKEPLVAVVIALGGVTEPQDPRPALPTVIYYRHAVQQVAAVHDGIAPAQRHQPLLRRPLGNVEAAAVLASVITEADDRCSKGVA